MSAFVIKCRACGWTRETSGASADLADLREAKTGCRTCGKPRKFVCPRCKSLATMRRDPS